MDRLLRPQIRKARMKAQFQATSELQPQIPNMLFLRRDRLHQLPCSLPYGLLQLSEGGVAISEAVRKRARMGAPRARLFRGN